MSADSGHLNNGLHTLETIHKLFDVVSRCVADSGGDGWGIVVCRQYRLLADAFEVYEKSHHNFLTERIDTEDDIAFSFSQEGITFTAQWPADPDHYEIIVSVPWAAGTD